MGINSLFKAQKLRKRLFWLFLFKTYSLTQKERIHALEELKNFFSLISDKQQAWNELIRLTNDEDIYVRVSSNHSLGRVSIFKASQEENFEDYKNGKIKRLSKYRIYFYQSLLLLQIGMILHFYLHLKISDQEACRKVF